MRLIWHAPASVCWCSKLAIASAAHGGLIAFAKALAREIGRFGVTVNIVCPGPTEGPTLDALRGSGTVGAKIVEVAKANNIPIEENELLAGALSNVELGDEIPAELYKAVAEVLIFMLRLSGRIR